MIYWLRKLWHKFVHLTMYSDPCPDCNGCGWSGGYVGDGWNDFDFCETCWPAELCPSCSTGLSVVDAYLLCVDESQPCPFCGWTQKLGYDRANEWTFADHDWEGEE